MLKCGDYTLDRQIGWGRTATYYSAFAGDEAGDHRLVIRYSRYTDRSHVCAFLQSAAEQQTATASGCRRVAPVLDFGVAENGHAYTVNLNYEVSLAECIQAGSAIDHDRLRFLVTGILKALEELRDRFKRPHGNLTAGNILLDQKGEVILTDLAPPSQDLRYFPDLQALGLIIYQLVRQSVRVGFISPPLERSPEWSKSLADHADDWREFTNRMLLTQRGEGQEGLKRAVADLKALNTLAEKAVEVPVAPHSTSSGPSSQFTVPTPKKRKSRVGLVLAVLFVLGGISAGAFFYFRKAPEIVDQKDLPPPPPTPAQIAMKIPDATAYPAGDGSLKRAKQGTPSYSEIASQLIYNWRVPAELASLAMKWNAPERNWQALARGLQTDAYDELAAQGLEAKPEVLMNVALNIGQMAEALKEGNLLESAWTQILASAPISSPAKIEGLPTFKDWASWRIESSSDIKTAKARASAVAASLASFDKVARESEGNIHPDAWKKAIASLKDFKEAKVADQWPQAWANAIKASLKPDQQILKKWTADLDAAKAQIARRPDARERAKLEEELRGLELRVQQALATDDANALSQAIASFKGKIRHPLEDMDEQYRALFTQLDQALNKAGTTADAEMAVKAFVTAVGSLRSQKEFETTLADFDAHHPTGKLIEDLTAGLQKPTQPDFKFGESSKWAPSGAGSITETKGTFVWNNNGPAITFHILKGLNVAIASIETSLELANSSGVTLDAPKDGPLAFRDNPGAASPWLWRKAEQWYQSAQRRWSERDLPAERVEPRTLFLAPNVDKCPVTWISAETARKIATALGSRLPTRAEWAEALKKPSLKSVRLRGAAATRFDKEVTEYSLLNRGSVTPFAPVPQSLTFPGAAPKFPEVTPDNDGSVWLRAVTDNPAGFSDLIGNASEWIDENGETYVVGGSFATDPRVNYTAPVRSAGAANFDITLRLAVPVTEGEKNAGLLAVRDTSRIENARLQAKAPIKMRTP